MNYQGVRFSGVKLDSDLTPALPFPVPALYSIADGRLNSKREKARNASNSVHPAKNPTSSGFDKVRQYERFIQLSV